MKLTIVVLVLLKFSWSSGSGPSRVVQDGVDPGQPLFLTPLIEAGQLDQARAQSQVSDLPGSPEGEIGKSYSGYLTVNKKYNSNLFFWYFPAQVPSPQGAPVLLWLQGGPGASSLLGLFVEHGPVFVTKQHKLKLREYAWTSQFHMVYIDQPAGTGFSFTDSEDGYATNQTRVADDLYQALVQFFTLFSELQQSDFYVTGESYAGKYVPSISYKLHQEQPDIIRFRGFAIGNGLVDPVNMLDYGHYLYQLGLLDENQRQVFLDQQDIARNLIKEKKWTQACMVFDKLILGQATAATSFLNFTGLKQHYDYLITDSPVDQSYYAPYLVRSSVRRAIHVGNLTYHNGTEVELHLVNDILQSTAPLVSLLLENYKAMIYTGQLDLIVPYPLTMNFLRNLDWSGAEAFKNSTRVIWKVDDKDSEVAGYVRQAGRFYQVLVRNGGHILPYDQPRAAFDMITRFVFDKHFP